MTALPGGAAVAAQAVAAAREGIAYAQMDCQAFVEAMVARAGGRMAYAGSNDMARNGMRWLCPLSEARAAGRLKPGAALFIHAADGGEPERYRADGLGNFSHVGLYAGEGALTDADKQGRARVCNAVHSSATMGRVAGSTLQNGWTHAGWFRDVAEDAEGEQQPMNENATTGAEPTRIGYLSAPTGKTVNLRRQRSVQSQLVTRLPLGLCVRVLEADADWACVSAEGYTGYVRRKYLCIAGDAEEAAAARAAGAQTPASPGEAAGGEPASGEACACRAACAAMAALAARLAELERRVGPAL